MRRHACFGYAHGGMAIVVKLDCDGGSVSQGSSENGHRLAMIKVDGSTQMDHGAFCYRHASKSFFDGAGLA